MERRPAQRVVRCPSCGGESRYAAENAYRPFCSARCKNIDFGGWSSESFRLKATPEEDTAGDDPPSPLRD